MLAAPLAAALGMVACAGLAFQSTALDEEKALHTGAVLEDRGTFPFQGESMHFAVEHTGFKARLLEIAVTVGHEGLADDGTPYIPITGTAASVSIARMLARVDDAAETYIDPQTWQPHYAVKDLDENGKARSYFVWFWPDELFASVEKHHNDTVSKKKVPLPAGTLDAISWVYHLREMDLTEGAQQSWLLYDGWIISRMTVVVGDREQVWTPMGFYDARRIDVYREKLESHWSHGALSGAYAAPELSVTRERYFFGNIWLSDDEQRIPVRLAVETKVGDLDLRLEAYHPPSRLEPIARQDPP